MKTDITVPMIIALADLLSGAVAFHGPATDESRRINAHTQKALISRKLAAIVPNMPLRAGVDAWLVIQPAGELVVSGYILGVETAEATAML